MRMIVTDHISKQITLSLVACVTFFFLLVNSAYSEELVINKSIIDKDTIWQGKVLIKGDVEVSEGTTLTIMPGTVVRFQKIEEFGPEKLSLDKLNHFPRAELIVRGHLYAQGTPKNKITFTSAEQKPHPGDWGSINFLGSVDNIIEFCIITYADTGTHSHSSQVVIAYSEFHHNGVAIGQKNVKDVSHKSVMPMLYNTITENGGGILYGGGSTTTISHNEVSNNEFFGIYAKKGGLANVRYNNITNNGKGVIFYIVKDIVLLYNNISDNQDYNVSLLDGQTTDINVSKNWWGTTDEKKIKNLIRDKTRDDSLGTVDFSGYLESPVSEAGISW